MAREFNGSTQDLRSSTALATGYPMTMACWFKADGAAGPDGLIHLSNGTAYPNDRVFSLGLDTSRQVTASVEAGPASYHSATTSASYTDNTWTHACGVFTSATVRNSYINAGNSGGNVANLTPTGINQTTIGAGRLSGAAYDLFDGSICEVAVWTVALTTTEISELYNSGIGLPAYFVRPDALVHYYRLLDSDGDVDWWGNVDLTATSSPTYDGARPQGAFFTTVPEGLFPVSAAGGNVTFNATVQSLASSIPAPSQLAIKSPSALSLSSSAPAPSLSNTISPTAQNIASTTPAPSISAGNTQFPSALNLSASLPAPTSVATTIPSSLVLQALPQAPMGAIVKPLGGLTLSTVALSPSTTGSVVLLTGALNVTMPMPIWSGTGTSVPPAFSPLKRRAPDQEGSFVRKRAVVQDQTIRRLADEHQDELKPPR